ncbi:hypothetical protein Pcinc_008194 [Petrolisthes cinctipes]|uniref:Uncharacterized protein n=1 Tax=Petrolisthes cinctipes TaxID=88211 RepID=A0AAE1KWP7_PETCI|nr:hypothetical protein Pcinc_008194 [Petrolisthes cinctipes]
MGLNCHYMTKPKPHRKRLEMEILLGDIHQLEKNGKITTSTALQPTLLAEAAKTRGVYNSKLLNKNHFLASKQLRDNPDIIIRPQSHRAAHQSRSTNFQVRPYHHWPSESMTELTGTLADRHPQPFGLKTSCALSWLVSYSLDLP